MTSFFIFKDNQQTIKLSINNKYDKCIQWAEGEIVRPDYNITTTPIYDALQSSTSSRLEAVVLDENREIFVNEYEKPYMYKMFIIGDISGTIPLIVYDHLIDSLKINETFIFTQIKWKKIHDKIILTTTPNTIISQTTNVVSPNLHNMEESMLFNQMDVQQINTCFEEITNSQKQMTCLSCKQNLIPIKGKEHLLKCHNCSQFAWCKLNDFNETFVLQIDNQKRSFTAVKDVLETFFQQQNANLPLTFENLLKYYMFNGPWKITLSHFHNLILHIQKI
ncbi:unnamed protein product [Adineta steineri]|uniref:Uncharacterized protein n=1 Tax=Adineta steineri TaxID=433720 RepID=A0A816A2J9_9BILA|nr:unnamed protein product [Adineta steineri]CAF1592540.1 unnamed protein product [Adineta steineri]